MKKENMKKVIIGLLIGAIILLAGCASTNYSRLDNDPEALDNPSEEEKALIEEIFDSATLVETFDDDRYESGFEKLSLPEIKDGALQLKPINNEASQYLSYENEEGFTSVTVCWKESASQGHLILWVNIPGFGRPTFFNNPADVAAHIHLDSLDGETEFLGRVAASNQSRWIIQEVRIEGDKVLMFRNGRLVFEYPIDQPRRFNRFTIGSNIGGSGYLDWIAVR